MLDRPPPLLCIHINRSVFDPRTYMIVKNPSNVSFPSKLNLSPYIVEPKDINMDARLPFRKQDEHFMSEKSHKMDQLEENPMKILNLNLNLNLYPHLLHQHHQYHHHIHQIHQQVPLV